MQNVIKRRKPRIALAAALVIAFVGAPALAQGPGEGDPGGPPSTTPPAECVGGISTRLTLCGEISWCVDDGEPPECPLERDGVPGPEGRPPVDTTKYHAGICSAPLGGMVGPVGIIRHDDVSVYLSRGEGTRINELTAGFFPKSQAAALAAAAIYMGRWPVRIYVPGHVVTTLRPECDMPETGQHNYTRVKNNIRGSTWNRYHLFLRNCQDWARAHS